MYCRAPAKALRPYSAICGPLTTSMRSMSTSRVLSSAPPPELLMASVYDAFVAVYERSKVAELDLLVDVVGRMARDGWTVTGRKASIP